MNRVLLAMLAAGATVITAAGVFTDGFGLFHRAAAAANAEGNNGQENHGPVAGQLPIGQIVLFSSGVGYFQREGAVDGNARVDLSFPVQDINDLLKSMVLQDRSGGQVSVVSYDSHDPIEKTLKSFALDLTDNPSLSKILL